MNPLANTPCCVCGTSQSELFFETKFAGYSYSPATFHVQKCAKCGLLFNSPRLPDADFPDLYGRNYDIFNRRDSSEFKRIVPMYHRTIPLVEGLVREKRVLEVGSGKGYLLALLEAMGWDVYGIDISSVAADYAQENIGIHTYVGTAEDYAEGPDAAKFPLVLAIDLIEHVLYPDRFINSLGLITESDGFLVIVTPNAGASNLPRLRHEWKGFNPFHIFVFSLDNITELLSKAGFIVHTARSYGTEGKDSRRLRGALRAGFRRAGLLGLAKSVYRKVSSMADIKHQSTLEYLTIALDGINRTSNSQLIETDELLPEGNLEGDNLIVVARKQ